MIAIIDYNAGNSTSVANALESLGYAHVLTSDPKIIAKADKVIFPGQGRAGQAMSTIEEMGLADVIKNLRVPFLGICIGFQLMSDYSEEDNISCLSIIHGRVKRFQTSLPLTQVVWTRLTLKNKSPFLGGIPDGSYMYFVHSYYFDTDACITASSLYDIEYPCIVEKDNFYGVQFHPEKSGAVGLQLLSNFCAL